MSEFRQHYALIRHGESETNRTRIAQTGNEFDKDPLTDYGREQVRSLAEEMRGMEVEAILTSSHLRARQTAEILNEVAETRILVPVIEDGRIVDKGLDEVDREDKSLLRERDSPSEIAGKSYQNPIFQAVKEEIESRALDQDWHYSDEENYFDQWQRAGMIEEYLRQREESTVAVVSHGGILKMLLAYIENGNNELVPLENILAVYINTHRTSWFDNSGYLPLNRVGDKQWQIIRTHNNHLSSSLGFADED